MASNGWRDRRRDAGRVWRTRCLLQDMFHSPRRTSIVAVWLVAITATGLIADHITRPPSLSGQIKGTLCGKMAAISVLTLPYDS